MDKHKSGELCSVDVLCGTGYGVPHVYKEHSKPRMSRQTSDNTESIKEVALKALESINGGKINVIKQTLDQMEHAIDQDMLEEKLKKNKSTLRYKLLECYKKFINIFKYVIIIIVTVFTLAVGVNELKPIIGNAFVGLPYNFMGDHRPSNDHANERLINDLSISKETKLDINDTLLVNLTKHNTPLPNEHSPYEYSTLIHESFPIDVIDKKNDTLNIILYNRTTVSHH